MRRSRFAFFALVAACGGPTEPVHAPTLVGIADASVAAEPRDAADDAVAPTYVLDALPADVGTPIDVDFEHKIHLVGAKVEPGIAMPGTRVKITLFWRCDETIEAGWKLFTHVADGSGAPVAAIDEAGPLRAGDPHAAGEQVLGPSRWLPGKFYVDALEWTVPTGVTSPKLRLYVGIWKGDARLRIVAGPNDGDNRAVAATIDTGQTAPRAIAPPPHLDVQKLTPGARIVIDGRLDEPEWATAASTGAFVDVATGNPNTTCPANGSAKLLWDDQMLYVSFDVQQDNPYTGFTSRSRQPNDFTAAGQPKLWMKDCVEMMFDPDGDGDGLDYYELQISPQNTVFHSRFDTPNQPYGGPNGPFGHEGWNPGMKSAVSMLRAPHRPPVGYRVEAAIAWKAFGAAAHHPPRPGDTWRMNFYAMRNNGGVAWSPILGRGNFHHAPRFGYVTWR